MLTNCTAYAKIVTVKRTNTQRVLVTFDNTKKDKHNCIIVNSHNAVYKSGDIINLETYNAQQRAHAIAHTMQSVRDTLRVKNIVLV